MRIFKKVIILVLLVITISIPVQAWSIPEEYHQDLFELRGSWVSTVSNLDFQKQTSIDQYKSNYLKVLNTFQSFNMNAVFFQVRPTNDAFYASELNPWSRFLIGSEGKDPGWDPMEWMVEVTHDYGMEFHAWLNPYRASLDVFSQTVDSYLVGLSGTTRDYYFQQYMNNQYKTELNGGLSSMSSLNFAKKHPELLIQGGLRILLNPAEALVRNHIYQTILEIVTNYNVDAIHFDDYFYNDVSLDSDKQLFMSQTGAATYDVASHKNWRRANVDTLIQGIDALLEEFNTTNHRKVQFGISPAGGWAPAISETCSASGYGRVDGMEGFPCNGYSSYHDLYADTRKWVKEEWIDYILPQNYYELGRYHEEITDWWDRTVEGTSVRLYMGLGPFKLNEYAYLTDNEYINQLRFDGQYKNVSGYVLFSAKNLISPSSTEMTNSNNKIKGYWTKVPILPVYLSGDTSVATTPITPAVVRKNQLVEFTLTTNVNDAGYALYRFALGATPDFDEANIHRLIPNSSQAITFSDEVTNDATYSYYLKSISKTGVLGTASVQVDVATTFVNQVPTVTRFELPGSNVYAVGNTIHIEGEVADPDQDDLIVELFYSFDGNRYRYNVEVEVVDGAFEFDFVVTNNLSSGAHFKLEVRDATDTTTALSKLFYVVGDETGPLERQMYYVTSEIERIFQEIMTPGA